ncbi:MAG: hypothetical protein NT031_15435 [Planctomycetota bacterium]|nr:hypothetical protein [Planctomycetota bacterium]
MLRTAMYMMMLPSAAMAGADPPAVAWDAIFAQDDPARRAVLVDAAAKACENDPARVRASIAADVAYKPFDAGWGRHSLRVKTGDRTDDVEFHVRVPPGYNPDEAKSWPLLVLAHGQGSDGPRFGREVTRRLGEAADNYILLSPTLPGERLYSGRAYQEQAWLAPLTWARRTLNVDDDRIYITGYSLGGHHTWHLATMFAHLWAAAVPMAGVPLFEGSPYVTNLYLSNLAPLPMWAIWGELDRATAPALGNVDLCRLADQQLQRIKAPLFTGTELPGATHLACWPKGEELTAYLAKHKRTLAPATFTHAFHLPTHARAYYLDALEYTHPPMDIAKGVSAKVEAVKAPTQQQLKDAFQATFERQIFQINATLDTGANSLTIRAPGVQKVRLYLYDGMLDLSRPVTIRFWTSTWKGRLAPSARCLLTHYAATRDATGLVLNEVDLDASGVAVPRYADKPAPAARLGAK